jgi:putative transposase
MAVATGVQTTARYILPFIPKAKNLCSIKYQSDLTQGGQNKLKAYEIYKMNKLSMEEIAGIFEVNKSTISRWIKQVKRAKQIRRYQHLEPRSRKPHRTPRERRIKFEIEEMILKTREKYKCGKDKLSQYLLRDYGVVISPSTIHRYLVRLQNHNDPKIHNRVNRSKKHDTSKRSRKIRYKDIEECIRGRAFEHFQIDTKYWTINGKSFYVIAAIDVITRMLFARAYSTHSSRAAKDFLKRLDYLFDIKNSKAYIQRDNGSEFMGDFEKLAIEYKITLITNYAKRPQMNGYIERLNRSLKEECLEYYMPSTVVEANGYLHDFIVVYNFERIHDGLFGLTPFERACELKFKQPLECILNSTQRLLHMYRTSTSD